MDYKTIKKPKIVILKTKVYEVWYCMKGYNVWHRDTSCLDYSSAYTAAMQLQKKCKCWVEIKEVEKQSTYYRFYKEVGQ